MRITVTETEKRRSEVCLPGGAENGDADSDGDADGREGIGRDGHECPAPRTRMCHHRRRNSDRVANGMNEMNDCDWISVLFFLLSVNQRERGRGRGGTERGAV